MIIDFNCRETEKIWRGTVSLSLPRDIQSIARRKLRMLNNSNVLSDLKSPPGNRLEPLKGDLKGFYSIRINNQWRICFIWNKGNVYKVKIVDYH